MRITKRKGLKAVSMVMTVLLIVTATATVWMSGTVSAMELTTKDPFYAMPTIAYKQVDSLTATNSPIGAGYNGTEALQLTSAASKRSTINFQNAAAGRLELGNGGTFRIKFKIKKAEGSIVANSAINDGTKDNSFAIGFQSSAAVNGSSWHWAGYLNDGDLSTTEYKSFAFDVTLAQTSAWYFMAIRYWSGTSGVTIYIDDLQLYKVDGETESVLCYEEEIDTSGSFDAEGPFTYKYGKVVENKDNNIGYVPTTVIGYRPAHTTVVPVLSALGEGVDGSYAVKLDATNANSHMLAFQNASRTVLTDGKYRMEFKAKVTRGNLKYLKAGSINNADTSVNFYNLYVGAADAPKEWTYYTFEHIIDGTGANGKNSWNFLNIAYAAADAAGVTLLIDDLRLYFVNADGTETLCVYDDEVETDGSFDTAYDKTQTYEKLAVDNTADSSMTYLPVGSIPNGTTNTNKFRKSAPALSALGDGVKGTYAMKIGASSVLNNAVFFKTEKIDAFAPDTEYVMEAKVKVTSGTLKDLTIGLSEVKMDVNVPTTYTNASTKNTDTNSAKHDLIGHNYSLVVDGSELSNEWVHLKWTHKTSTASDVWKFLEIAYHSEGTTGATLLIDDLKVYKKDDPYCEPIQYQYGLLADGSFETAKKSFVGKTVDNTADPSVKHIPVTFNASTGVYNDSTSFPKVFDVWAIEGQTFNTAAVAPRLTSLGGGVKGSYAMVIGNDSQVVTDDNKYIVKFAFPASSTLVANTEYTFKVKLKYTGAIDTFKLGFQDDATVDNINYSMYLFDYEMSNDWLEYTWNYTTQSVNTANAQGNLLCLTYTSDSTGGATVYIDDLMVYETAKGEDYNIFPQGDFDYTNLGQEKVVFTNTNPEDQKPVFRSSTCKDSNGAEAPRVVECNAHSGKYALAFGFDKTTAADSTYTVSILPTKPGGTYKVSFWVKVEGEVNNAYIGMMDSFQKYKYYQGMYNFNQYEQGKWTKVEFIMNDTATINDAKGYRFFIARFNAPAGSGMLIDDIRITDVTLGDDAPNLIEFGSFEKFDVKLPTVTWSDRYTYKEGK